MRTSNNIFVLKTLIDKQFHKNKKLYTCFVDFSKAFDTIWRKGLIAKLNSFGIEGKMLNIIKDLYSSTNGHVTVGEFMSDNFKISLGVKQGDPPSPFFFNIYMDELCTNLLETETETEAPIINDNKVPCLFWADDLLLISKSKQGLQKQIEIVDQYCSDWKLTLNVEKTKTVIFNKAGATLKKEQIQYRGKNIKTVKHFKYLGILLDSNGKFQTAINELTKKAAKALGRVYRLSTCNFISTNTLLDTFTSLVKPIMLFSSEIWGYELKPDTNAIENLFNKFCKHILGVHRNTTNLAIQGELGTFSLLIDVKISMVSYYLYLRQLNNHLITDLLTENKTMHAQNNNRRSWISMVEQVINENSINITSYQYKTKRIGDSNTKLLNQDKLKALLKTNLQSKFKEIWSTKTTKMSKLSFYRQHKINHKFEEYLTLLENRRYKSAITKLRCSAHRLEIEIGRYNRIRNEVTGKMEPLPREKRLCDICKEKVEEEYHFLFECQVNKQLRDKFLNEMNTLIGDNFKTMNHFDKTKLLFETTDKYILNMFGKYVYTSFEKHRKHTNN